MVDRITTRGLGHSSVRHSVLHDILLENPIQIVNPSEHISEAYRKKSKSYLSSAQILLDNGHFEESVSMAYYSMYYMVMALFSRNGIKCENHSASILLLNAVFDIDNAALSVAKRDWIDTQYHAEIIATRKDGKDLIRVADLFTSRLADFIAHTTNENIVRYRKKLRTIIE
jgi:uncharacterized protein (UPF0332 family)